MRSENHERFLARLKLKVTQRETILIDWAYINAKYGHRNQQREGGERYFEHIRAVALVLIDELGIYDAEMIQAALMHDMLEDSHLLDYERIEILFGKNVADMVELLSIPAMTDHRFFSKDDRLDFYHRKIKDAPRRVKIIKLCDRLHNLRTLQHCSVEKQLRKAKETANHYLPMIADLAEEYPEVAQLLQENFESELQRIKQ